MLLKLIKYDFREQFREHIGLYALVFVSALTEIILDSFEFDLVSVFFWALHSLSVIAMLICSLVIIVIYFRRNLLKDEGYLMNTLPVEPWKLYVSKFLTAFVLFILDLIVAVLTFSIMNHGFAWIKDIIGSMSDEFANAKHYNRTHCKSGIGKLIRHTSYNIFNPCKAMVHYRKC